jgi:hypothetical protein
MFGIEFELSYYQGKYGNKIDEGAMFNKIGAEGWEPVSVDNGRAYFKRVLEVPASMRVKADLQKKINFTD